MELAEIADMFEQPERLKQRLQAIAKMSLDDLVTPEFMEHLDRMVDVTASRGILKQIETTKLIAKTAIELADQVDNLPLDLLPAQILNDIDDVAKDLLEGVAILNRERDPQAVSVSQQKIARALQSLEQRCKDFCTRVLPIYSYLSFKQDSFRASVAQIDETLRNAREKTDEMLRNAREKTDEELKAVEKSKAELDSIVQVARDTAAQAAVSYHAQEFGKIAQEHTDASRQWLIASISLIFTTITVALLSLFVLPPLGALNEPATIQRLITKIVIASILYYAAIWAAKNYKTHRHLAVVNLHRQSALKTFEAFVKASSSDEQTKNAVLLEATRSIFAPSNTGYLGAEEENPSSRIIEIFKNVGGSSVGK